MTITTPPLPILLLLILTIHQKCIATTNLKSNKIHLSSHQKSFSTSKTTPLNPKSPKTFLFPRYQSPSTIQNLLSFKNKSNFKYYQGRDGRKGFVSCTRLDDDYVLAESKQVAVGCSTEEVLGAYLCGKLQKKWNAKEVLDCNFTCKSFNDDQRGIFGRGKYYKQDLTLHSQRIIKSHTGIMKYSQNILIDKIGQDNYSILISLDPSSSSTKKKPFESLQVYVNLKQNGNSVDIYAAGLMKVNRSVVPNLIVFDASSIAGGMAGRGTLWLAGYFDKRIS